MIWHLAEIFETVADAVPGAPAIWEAGRTTTWADFDARAARIAGGLERFGLGPDSKVGIYAYNCAAYLEAQFAAFKLRGGPVNVNYRYTEDELVYLLDNADAEALVFDAAFGPRVAQILGRLPRLKALVEIDDGSGAHLDGAIRLEQLIADSLPAPRRVYSEDDIYMLYTGGTTGMPKGVMYRHGDFARGALGGWALKGFEPPETREALVAAVRRLAAEDYSVRSVPACPIMHGTGLWLGVFMPQAMGGCAVLFRNTHFDPDALFRLVAEAKVTDMAIVGDAFARPMLEALDAAAAAGRPYDLSSLKRIISSGVMFSREVKLGLLAHADIVIQDGMGATEGSMGMSLVSRESPPQETAVFLANPTTKVFDENDEEIPPGSDRSGMIANGGMCPVGYYKDPEKSARTFRTIRGVRYSFPGDHARIAADGSLILLGRGSACINTGGEKVFPEEVEEAIKAHPDVFDCLVVGTPDTRFGERVEAVVSPRPGRALSADAIQDFVRERLAAYKAPRRIHLVDAVRRAPNGKADYPWARERAKAAQAGDNQA